jgi:hypothetical protein
MNRQWPQTLIMFSGMALIILGLIGITAQFIIESKFMLTPLPLSNVNVGTQQLSASTHYVGLELVLVGALLEIVGYLAATPWREPPQSN